MSARSAYADYGLRSPVPRPRPETVDRRPLPRYLVAIRIAFPSSLAATTDKVLRKAVDLGLEDVVVSTRRPPGAPIGRGDYYVEASYSGDPADIARRCKHPVSVADAWRIL